MPQIYWFLKDDEWHAYRLGGSRALCDKVAIAYNIDPVADGVPLGGVAHKGCLKAIAAEEKADAKAAAKEAKEAAQ